MRLASQSLSSVSRERHETRNQKGDHEKRKEVHEGKR